MIIYNIHIDNETQGLLFNTKGELVETYSQHFNKNDNFSTIVYKDHHIEMISERINTKQLNFKDLSEELKGIFILYNYDIPTIKNMMKNTQWNKFLALHFK